MHHWSLDMTNEPKPRGIRRTPTYEMRIGTRVVTLVAHHAYGGIAVTVPPPSRRLARARSVSASGRSST